VPFYKSKPSKYLVAMLLGVIGFAILVPYTPIGEFFGFVAPPPAFFFALVGILGAYAILAESVKNWFYKRNAHRLEQVLVPKRKTVYVGQVDRLLQDMVAVICLRSEDEISIDTLADDLSSVINYAIDANQMLRNLHHLRRSGLVSVDWQKRTVIRNKSLKDYVIRNVVPTEKWPIIMEDWRRTNTIILNKRGSINADYQELLLQNK